MTESNEHRLNIVLLGEAGEGQTKHEKKADRRVWNEAQTEILELKQLIDLAMHIHVEEIGDNTISEAGSPIYPVLKDLQARATRLWRLFGY
jgi:hypothetical protein